jgi:RNA polymerase sigma-70 factor (ECF subfamily)
MARDFLGFAAVRYIEGSFAEQPLKADPASEEERVLIEAAQRNPGRFAELYERNFERVYAYVARRVGSRAEAEDVTAEVFQQALANLPRFEWRGVAFAAWLRRMAANAIADRWQAARREAREPEREPAGEEDIERRAMLFQLVDTLPADQRRVVVGRFVEQQSIGEMARELGRSEGAVKQLQWRALKRLRDLAGRRANG